MRKLVRPLFFLGALSVLFMQTGCYGSFTLTNKIYDWNDEVASNKFVKSLLFWVLCIIPVYEFCVLADIVILNLIEFWTGSNPVSMKAGEYEQQLVEKGGVHYKMEATQNRFSITTLDGKKAGQKTVFVYEPKSHTWNLEKEGQLITIARVNLNENGENSVAFNTPSGKVINTVLPSDEESLATAKNAMMQNVAVK